MIELCGFGVSNYYIKLKLILLEKGVPFRETVVYPWSRNEFLHYSPLGKIPYVVTEYGGLSESQVILEYIEDRYPDNPLYPTEIYARAKCRELIQQVELNAEWVARRLYTEAFFNGVVSDETKQEAKVRLALGLRGVARLASFSPYVLGSAFSAADCVAFVHFTMIERATMSIYGENLLQAFVPEAAAFMQFMGERPHVRTMMADREVAMQEFLNQNVKYDG